MPSFFRLVQLGFLRTRSSGRARGLPVAFTLALPLLFWVQDGTYRASLTTLGRDQGIFQYIAWALERGAKDYRDIRDVNGPLTHFVHLAFLRMGGADEHRFRSLDLAVTGLSFAVTGACLPGIGRRRAERIARTPSVAERVAWAGAAWVVLSAQLLRYLYWDLAQRETFCNWFMLPSVGLQLAAQTPLPLGADEVLRARAGRRAAWMLGIAGALSAVPCFGKPTYALFSAAQLVGLLVDHDGALGLRARLRAFVTGGLVAVTAMMALLARYADIGAFFRIYLIEAPQLYRFIWARSAAEILSAQNYAATACFAVVTSVAMLALIWARAIPRRLLPIALVPLCGLLNVLLQRKGFPYHFHPATAGVHVAWLALVLWTAERHRTAPRAFVFARMVPYMAAGALALEVGNQLQSSPHIENLWILEKGITPELRASHDYLVYFGDRDFFPWEMRQAADYLRAHTRPEERVQVYGMDPYVLFLAGRLSATPYIYAYDLNADAALTGGWSLRPDGRQTDRIRQARDAHERDLLARMNREPPAAFVFFDKAPLLTNTDAWVDFEEHNPTTAAWVREHYLQAVVFGADRIWLRRDVAARERQVSTKPLPSVERLPL